MRKVFIFSCLAVFLLGEFTFAKSSGMRCDPNINNDCDSGLICDDKGLAPNGVHRGWFCDYVDNQIFFKGRGKETTSNTTKDQPPRTPSQPLSAFNIINHTSGSGAFSRRQPVLRRGSCPNGKKWSCPLNLFLRKCVNEACASQPQVNQSGYCCSTQPDSWTYESEGERFWLSGSDCSGTNHSTISEINNLADCRTAICGQRIRQTTIPACPMARWVCPAKPPRWKCSLS